MPVVLEKTGTVEHPIYDVVAGHEAAAAAKIAAGKDPHIGEMLNAFVANDKQEAEAFKYQASFFEAPSGEHAPPSLGEKRGHKDETWGTTVGNASLVNPNKIDGEHNYDPDVIEQLAHSQLRVGNILPIVVQRSNTDKFKVVAGHLALAAARRAKEIDPKRAEKTRVFIAENDKQAKDLAYQVGNN